MIMQFPYEPRPGATTKEVLADPRNWILVIVMGVSSGLLAYLFFFVVYLITGWDASALVR